MKRRREGDMNERRKGGGKEAKRGERPKRGWRRKSLEYHVEEKNDRKTVTTFN